MTLRLAALPLTPPVLLGALVAVVGALAAVFSNDIVCLAMAPVLIDACLRRRLDPIPFLLALAAAANIGSALTLIGNPQNMLIGQSLRLSFAGYIREAAVPVLLGLAAAWAVIVWRVGGRWESPSEPPRPHRRPGDGGVTPDCSPVAVAAPRLASCSRFGKERSTPPGSVVKEARGAHGARTQRSPLSPRGGSS